MKLTKITFLALGSSALISGCLFDDAKEKIAEIERSANQKIAEAERTADGLLKDPALRDSALSLLRQAMPEDLTVSSALEITDSLSIAGKAGKISKSFELKSLGSNVSDLAQCLKAIPQERTLPNPDCYGPSLEYDASKHPDGKGSIGVNPGMPLPPGDLGIWKENWTHPNGKSLACAAAKTNQLIANASYYPDLAVGTMAMMVCVAAFHGDTLPGPGSKVDMTAKLQKLSDAAKISTPWKGSFESASIANVDGSYRMEFKGVLAGDTLQFDATHNSTKNSGNVAIKSLKSNNGPQMGMNAPMQSITVQYAKSGDALNIKLAKASYGRDVNQATEAKKRWENSISNGILNTASSSFDGDLNIMTASIGKVNSKLAYGWQAGSGDGFLRVFNVDIQDKKASAWFGFSPHAEEKIDQIAKLLTIDRMICNWAGPGNQKTGLKLAQRQDMEFVDGTWKATLSKIKYAPTNSCTITDASVFPSLGAVQNHELIPLDASQYTFTVPNP
jgi:hypothetical protein